MEIKVKDSSVGLDDIEKLSEILYKEFNLIAEKPVRLSFITNKWIVKFVELNKNNKQS